MIGFTSPSVVRTCTAPGCVSGPAAHAMEKSGEMMANIARINLIPRAYR